LENNHVRLVRIHEAAIIEIEMRPSFVPAEIVAKMNRHGELRCDIRPCGGVFVHKDGTHCTWVKAAQVVARSEGTAWPDWQIETPQSRTLRRIATLCNLIESFITDGDFTSASLLLEAARQQILNDPHVDSEAVALVNEAAAQLAIHSPTQ
jgi:hypothetical protein